MFDLGGIYPAALKVTDENGLPMNALSVTLTITLPDGTTVTPTPSNTGTGSYVFSYLVTQPGRHMVRWVTTAPDTGYTDVFDVAEANTPAILSLAAAKQHLQMDAADSTWDEMLREVLMGVTAEIENYKKEIIVRRVFTENYTFALFYWNWQAPRLRLHNTPILSLDSLTDMNTGFSWDVSNQTNGTGNLLVDYDTGIVSVLRGPPVTGNILASYTAGRAIVPYNYLEGAKIALQHWWEKVRGPGGIGGAVGPEELHVAAGVSYALPKTAMEMLGAPQPVVA